MEEPDHSHYSQAPASGFSGAGLWSRITLLPYHQRNVIMESVEDDVPLR
jgi:hypothetical protein